MKRTYKNVFCRTLLLSITGLLAGISIYGWNARVVLGNPLPTPFGYGFSVVLSGSMEPTLHIDDLVIIKENKAPQIGDIAVYQDEGMLIIHRLTAKDGEMLIFRGDANSGDDKPVSPEAVKGTLIMSIPKLGALVRIIRKPLVLLSIFLLALVISEHSYRQEKKDGNEEIKQLRKEIENLTNELDKEGLL